MAFIERTGEHEIRRGMSRMDFMRPMFTGGAFVTAFHSGHFSLCITKRVAMVPHAATSEKQSEKQATH